MPFNFSGQSHSYKAKLGVVDDGDLFTTAGTAGAQVASGLSAHSVFKANPVRTGVGQWSITTKDNVVTTCALMVTTVTAAGTFIHAQENTPSVVSGTGQKTYKWTFFTNAAGTDTAADLAAGAQFRVYLSYAETRVGV